MAELKTKLNDGSVDDFLNSIEDPVKRADSFLVSAIMEKLTGDQPKMWGSNIIGFGTYHYKYASGREGNWFITGFSPRKQNLTLYLMSGFTHADALLSRLGKYKTGKSCLYIKKLEDINMNILEELIVASMDRVKELYG